MSPGVLHVLRARLTGWLALRALLLTLGVAGAVALAALLLDATLDLPEGARAIAPLLLALCAAAVPAAGVRHWHRLDEQRLARWFQQIEPSLGSRLINAVQLSSQTAATGVEEFLRREAVELGSRAAAGQNVWPAVRAGVRLAAAVASVAVLAWFVFAFGAADVLQAVAPRFLDPHGDHPPYSKLCIDVSPAGGEVLYGGQLEIRARVSGRPADKLWLIMKSGTNTARTLMFLAPDRSFFQALSNLRERAVYFVTDGKARSRRFPIGIRYTPQITLVELATTFPDYTGRPPRSGRLPDEPQALPGDTRLGFRVASNRPLKSGLLTLTPVLGGKTTQIPLQPEPQNTMVNGAFTLTEPVVFSLSVRDVDGLDCAEPRQGRFNILPDERPRLFVLEPGRDAVATPTIRVPVRVQAQDDYGVARVAWLRGHNQSIERPFNMRLELKSSAQSVEAAGALDFARLGVRPGDVIEYYFEAADNYPKGPNVTLSRMYRVQIISPEQYAAILRQAAARKALFEPYFKLDAWLNRLAERARNLDKLAQSDSEADRQAALKEAAALAQDLAKYQAELGQLLPQAIHFDVEQSFRETLVEQLFRVRWARKSLEEALKGGQLDPKAMAAVAEELTQTAQSAQDDVDQPAAQIAAVAHLLARADTFVKLAQEQAALARMLRRFADKTGDLSRIEQIEMQELAYRQRRIQEGLHSFMDGLPELLAKLPQDPKYDPLRQDVREFLEAIADAKIEPDLAGSARLLNDLDGKGGAALAQTAAEKMDRLIAKCSGLPQQGKLCLRFQPKIQKALGNTLEQILAAMGANSGSGQSGRDGYSLFNDDVALYGPDMELAGEQAGGRRDTGPTGGRRAERLAGDPAGPGFKSPETSARVRLQPEARFPLRYRDLVGDYFRAIAESESGEGEK